MLTIEIETISSGDFNYNNQTSTYATIQGRDTLGRHVRATGYGPVADGFLKTIQRQLQPGMDLKDARIVIQLEGEWKSRQKPGFPRPQRYYKFDRFDIPNGPSMVLLRATKDATVALRSAKSSLDAEDVKSAYLSLETFVARFTSQPAPSLDHADIFDPDLADEMEASVEEDGAAAAAAAADDGNDGDSNENGGENAPNPERDAVKRLAAYDSRHGMPGQSEPAFKVFKDDPEQPEPVQDHGDEAKSFGADVPVEASEEGPVETVDADDVPFPVDEPPANDPKVDEAKASQPAVEAEPSAEPKADAPAAQPARKPVGFAGMRPPVISASAKAVASSASAESKDEGKPSDPGDEVPAQPNRQPPVRRAIGLGMNFRR